jgi:acetylornithine deacetylase
MGDGSIVNLKSNNAILKDQVEAVVDDLQEAAIRLLQDLVRIPSVNHPPYGDEKDVQEFFARHLRSIGLKTDIYDVDKVQDFSTHPGRLVDHDMSDRPNVVGLLKGKGDGRSLLLMAHADVESPGEASEWLNGDPFSGIVRDGRVYGRGVADNKAGMAIIAMVPQVIQACGVDLKGDLIIASVVDEEQGGGNGSIALLANGCQADAAVYVDGNDNTINLMGLGGGYCTIEIEISGLVVDSNRILYCMGTLSDQIDSFNHLRLNELRRHPYYRDNPVVKKAVLLTDFGRVSDTKGFCRVWFYLFPGEVPENLKDQVESHFKFPQSLGKVQFSWMTRFLPPADVSPAHPFVKCLCEAFQLSIGREPIITGSLASDMGLVNHYGGFPCILFGPLRWGREGSVHQPNEFVELSEFFECLKTLIFTTTNWCGISQNDG